MTLALYFVATPNADYVDDFWNVTFPSGSTDSAVVCVEIVIIEDGSLEGDQMFDLILTTSDADVLLGNARTAITLVDNDSQFLMHNACYVSARSDSSIMH